MIFVADHHVHSRYSDGTSTLRENVEAALERNLHCISLTEHGPNHLVSGLRRRKVSTYFNEIAALKAEYAGRIRVQAGLEANIVRLDGHADLPRQNADVLEVVGLAYHRSALGENIKSNAFLHLGVRLGRRKRRAAVLTDMLIRAMERYTLSFLAHPGQHTGPLEWDRLARALVKHNVAVELSARPGHLCMSVDTLRFLRRAGVVFVVNSDAHRKEEIGRFESIYGLIEDAGLTYHDIVNAQGYDGKRPYGL